MFGDQAQSDTSSNIPGKFENTHWSLVLLAARDPADTCAREALARLCETYWKPLYCFVRRQGHTPQDAEDLTQAFFARFLAKHLVAAADPTKGSFRSFLLGCLKNFMANEWAKANARKRAPDLPVLSFEAAEAETCFRLAPVDKDSPDRIYERDCAWALVGKAIARLRTQYEASGKLELYKQLSPSLMGDADAVPYRELAEKLHATEGALRMEASRMRKKLRKCLKELLIPVGSNPADADSEFRALMQVLQ